MEAQQTPPPVHTPDHYDIPSMIVIYALVTILGVGMCFCLRKANRLVPNKYSFPLALRRSYNKKQDDESDEDLRQGLLNDYSDQEEDEDEEQRIGTYRGNQRRSLDRYNDDHLEEDEEDQGRELTDIQRPKQYQYSDDEDDDEFGALQGASPIESESSATTKTTTKKPVVFVVDDDDEDDDDDDNNNNKDIKKST